MVRKIKSWLSLGIIPAIIAGTYYITSPNTDLGGAAVIFIGHYVLLATIAYGVSKCFDSLRQ